MATKQGDMMWHPTHADFTSYAEEVVDHLTGGRSSDIALLSDSELDVVRDYYRQGYALRSAARAARTHALYRGSWDVEEEEE